MGSFLGFQPEVVQKSQWRIDFERYLREEAMKPRPIVKAAQIQERQEKAVRVKRNPPGTGRKPRPAKTDRRLGVRRQKDWLVKRTKFCGVCQAPLNANNSSGHCKKHWCTQRRIALFGERPKCTHEGCENRLYRDNVIGLCRKHGNPVRGKAWEEANKEKSVARKKAWNAANPGRRRKR